VNPNEAKFTIVIQDCDEGGYHGYVEGIQGCHSQGETVAETIVNTADALAQLIEYERLKMREL
jgi:predicted RNase H-like HicB family nuclease